jgi:choline transport protein
MEQVDSKTYVPSTAVFITSMVAALLALITIGSPTTFNDIVALAVSAIFISYCMCVGLLLWRRCTGGIREASEVTDQVVNTVDAQLVWGPFRMPGLLGIAVNTFSVIFSIIVTFFSFWPPATPVTALTMNYAVVGTGGVFILSMIYYFVWARKIYDGPVIEIVDS